MHLELGSTAPLIVDADGDWETAADKTHLNAFSYAGQSCISIQRILVHERVTEAFTQRLAQQTKALKVGNPLSPETDVGPLISRVERERVLRWINEAVADGGELVAGGHVAPDGQCVSPTIISEPPFDARVWCEDVFGPVVSIVRVSSFEEALSRANDSSFGLQAGVFTNSIGRAI